MGGKRRQETGGEITQGHEECGRTEGQPDSGCPQTQRTPPRNSEKSTDSPVDVKLNAKIMGWTSLPHLPAPWVVLVQDTASQQSLHTTRGARVEWKGRCRIYHSVPGTALHLQNSGLSWGLGWTRMESFAYLTGLH